MAAGLGLMMMAAAVLWLFNLMVVNEPLPPADGSHGQYPSGIALFAALALHIAGTVLLFLGALTY